VNQGVAYVFVRSSSGWNTPEAAKLFASDGAMWDNFGNPVAISGTTVVVGAPVKNCGRAIADGAVYVFQRSGACGRP